jgi:hypothetical protein
MSASAAVCHPPALDALARMIGNMPLLAIDFEYRGRSRTVYAKCEYLNLTGGITKAGDGVASIITPRCPSPPMDS